LIGSSQSNLNGIVVGFPGGQPLEYATVRLILLQDSTSVFTTATDKKGRFLITLDHAGKFSLQVSFIGLKKYDSVVLASDHHDLDLGTIALKEEAGQLATVNINAVRPGLMSYIDRKVYNVEQDIMSKTGTASDVLRNLPSVEVDIEGGLSLRGSGVTVLINGKPSALMGRSQAEVLQQMPASAIERIEVITNPSARYRPDGTAGIINIVLKKNVKNGFNGSITFNAANHDRYNGSINLNYRPKKYNLFAGYSARQDYRFRSNSLTRKLIDNTGQAESHFSQEGSSWSRPVVHILHYGIDMDINSSNSIGVSGSYYTRNAVRNEKSLNVFSDRQGMLTSSYERVMNAREPEQQPELAAYYQHRISEESGFKIEYNRSVATEKERNYFINANYLPVVSQQKENVFNSVRENENNLAFDYEGSIGEWQIEAGYDGVYNRVDLDYFGEWFDPMQQRFVKDNERTNRFLFNEDIHAAYATAQRETGAFGYKLGLRAEQAYTKGNLLTLDSVVTNNYFRFYPTVHLSYRINTSTEIQANYSKRVNRPDADELNPFPEYNDPRNLYAGNPRLLPEVIHSTELGLKWQNKQFTFVPSLYYRYKVDGFTSFVTPLNDSTLLTTEQNLAKDRSAGLELVFSAAIGSFFRSSLNANFFHNTIDASNLGYSGNRSINSMSSNLNLSFIIRKTSYIQVNANYRSARQTPQGKTDPVAFMNMGLRQDLFKNKLSLILTASDLFNSLKRHSIISTPLLYQRSSMKRDGRIIYFGMNYRFGVQKKQKEDSLDFDNSL
jgi:outer membrane receptor protein involved in Fe transport